MNVYTANSAIVKVRMKGRLYSIVVGALAFWLPVVAMYASFRMGPSLLMLNVAPLLGLTALAFMDWTRKERVVKWNWALAGIYILGPILNLTASGLSGGGFPSLTEPGAVLFWALVLFFPPVTLLLSFYSFTTLSLLVASIRSLL